MSAYNFDMARASALLRAFIAFQGQNEREYASACDWPAGSDHRRRPAFAPRGDGRLGAGRGDPPRGGGADAEELLPLEHEVSGASWKSIGRDGEGARDEPHDPVVRTTRSYMRPIGPLRTRPARHAGGAMPGRVVAIRIELTPPIAG